MKWSKMKREEERIKREPYSERNLILGQPDRMPVGFTRQESGCLYVSISRVKLLELNVLAPFSGR
jgi:hypothetical protein